MNAVWNHRRVPGFAPKVFRLALTQSLSLPLALLLLISLVVRVVVVFVIGTPTPQHAASYLDAARYDTLAWHLAQGKGYVNALGLPEAKDPPLLPAFLAPIYAVFGHSYQAARVLLVLLGCFTVFALYRLTKQLFGPRVAMVTAAIAAVYPDLVSYSGLTMTESLYIPVLLVALTAYIRGLHTGRHGSFVVSGAFLGLAALARPEALFAPFVLAVTTALVPMSALQARLRRGLILICTALAILLPWTIRNALQFHTFLPVSVGSGTAFYVGSYVPWSGLDVRAGQSIYAQPFFTRLTRGLDAVTADRVLLDQAVHQILRSPTAYARLLPHKLFMLFRNTDSNGIYAGHGRLYWVKIPVEMFYVMVLVLILVGLFSLYRRWLTWPTQLRALAYLTIPFYLTIIHVLTIPASRYSFPIIALLLPFTGLGVVAVAAQVVRRRTRAIASSLGLPASPP